MSWRHSSERKRVDPNGEFMDNRRPRRARRLRPLACTILPAMTRRHTPPTPAALAEGLRAGDRAAVGRALTLVESSHPTDRELARELLQLLASHSADAMRVGFTGPPGAGKSSLLEAFGTWLADSGRKVAVYAVDPSSPCSGGSLLGDKTRMAKLSRHDRAFVRPAPSGRGFGSVARRTREALAVLAAAGYDPVFVETVGVGQNETLVRDLVDLLALVQSPVAGDELQSIKRGTLELADLVIVTMADGDLAARAARARQQWASSLGPNRPAVACSAHAGTGLEAVWGAITDQAKTLRANGRWDRRRADQAVAATRNAALDEIHDRFLSDPALADLRSRTEADVRAGRLDPSLAARRLIDHWLG